MIKNNYIPAFLEESLKKNINLNKINNLLVLETTNKFNITIQPNTDLCINIEKINNIRRVNKFHEAVNQSLVINGYYFSCVETDEQRKNRKKEKYFILIRQFVLFFDFVYKRLFPKLPIIKHLFFFITKGKNRVISISESYGRLVSCGFKIIDVINHKGLTYILSTKIRDPYYDMNPSYGPIFNMKRVGREGQIISVYKFRTMSPYSEYIQSKIIKDNTLDKGGKIKDDSRITFYGKFLRKYWIDEFPMIINWLKRDLKLVGVRPLSEDYFKRYPKDLQQLRIKTKPGLVPPYYVDLPVTFEEICQSERNYLNQYIKNPLKTDIIYFFKAFYNIIIKRRRSK